jgi:hypothetical protein
MAHPITTVKSSAVPKGHVRHLSGGGHTAVTHQEMYWRR